MLTGIQLGKIKQGTLKVNDTDKAYLEALHNAEITQSDTAFGALHPDLKAAGLYDTSAVIVISDHGDEFWDHGDCGHAQGAAPRTGARAVHHPRARACCPLAGWSTPTCEAMDLAPTLLDLAGLPIPDCMQGRSVLPLALDELAGTPATGLTQNETMARGLKSGRYRLIHSGVARMELFDEIDDPREQRDLSGQRPIALRQMRNVLALQAGFENVWKKRLWGSPANPNEAFYADNDSSGSRYSQNPKSSWVDPANAWQVAGRTGRRGQRADGPTDAAPGRRSRRHHAAQSSDATGAASGRAIAALVLRAGRSQRAERRGRRSPWSRRRRRSSLARRAARGADARGIAGSRARHEVRAAGDLKVAVCAGLAASGVASAEA